jgi:membrane associated rhomboid family serine protease
MPKVTIGFGAVLIALGLFGYFGSASENPSPTALIPAAVGAILVVCGLVAHKADLRPHAMHAAVLVGLIGDGGLTDGAGIAWEAHLGGFYAGLLLYGLFEPSSPVEDNNADDAADAS